MSFSEIWNLLKDQTFLDSEIPKFDGLYERLFKIIGQIKKQDRNYSKKDLASLIRNILLFEQFKNNHTNINVPNNDYWPTKELWEEFGMEFVNIDINSFTLRAGNWNCYWLSDKKSEFFDDVYSQKIRKPYLHIESDPSYKRVTSFGNYSSSGQRESIRSVVFMDPGSTIIVNLPTGSGKSMAGYINSLLDKNCLTVFIVPTVALAIDQERQFREFSNDKNTIFAWHSGLSNIEKKSIKDNINNKNQRIIFTSPEAVCSSLSSVLIKASERGYLKYFVIDECHLVAQWGDNFRPEFQSISGMRKLFLKNNPEMKTILMSATITDETLSTLETIFDLDNPPKAVSSVFLRGEPQYWVHKVQNEEEKFLKVLELIKFGPRPFILYFNEPKEVDKWVKRLRDEGYKRVEGFHGNTEPNERVKIINKWNNNDLDIIVATSAFGVGMDKQDIRMIIHATVPESLDRFYQEVGRAGRDGKSSISITFFTEYDYIKAKKLSDPRVITEESGIDRWKKLINSSKLDPNDNDLLVTNLSVVPDHLSQQSDANNSWNLRTILLLVRSKFIELEAKPLEISENLNKEEEKRFIEEHFNKVFFRVKNPNHLDIQQWDTKIAEERKKSIERNKKNFALLNSYLNNEFEISESLYKLYSINRNNFRVLVSKCCGGCYQCFEKGDNWLAPNPIALPIKKLKSIEYNDFQKVVPWLDLSQPIIVTYNFDLTKKNLQFLNILKMQLVKNYGIREINISKELKWLKEEELELSIKEKFVIFSDVKDYSNYNDNNINISLVTIIHSNENDTFPDEILFLKRPLHLIFVKEDIKDRHNIQRRFIDTQTNTIKFEKFKELINK